MHNPGRAWVCQRSSGECERCVRDSWQCPSPSPFCCLGDMPNPPLYFPQSTMSLSCPFSHSMPCTTWLLKIFFTYKQQAQPFQPLLPAGDGIDTAGDGIGAGWSGKTSVLVLIWAIHAQEHRLGTDTPTNNIVTGSQWQDKSAKTELEAHHRFLTAQTTKRDRRFFLSLVFGWAVSLLLWNLCAF